MAQLDLSQPPQDSVAPQDTGWAKLPTHSLQVEVITDGRRLIGTAAHGTLTRLVDMLRLADDIALPLTDVEVTPLDGRNKAPQRWPQANVHRRAIVFAIPHEVAAAPAAAVKRLEYIEKRRWAVSALLPGFLVTGYYHLPPAADPANTSLFWNAGFVPLTDAEAVYLNKPSITWKAEVIVVNTACVEAYCPAAALADE